jgi:hypothetical protein
VPERELPEEEFAGFATGLYFLLLTFSTKERTQEVKTGPRKTANSSSAR